MNIDIKKEVGKNISFQAFRILQPSSAVSCGLTSANSNATTGIQPPQSRRAYEIQKTKPQSLGYGLTDSPAGLAGWIVEKYFGWFNDNDNNLVATTDEVLSIISLYWFSNSINSSLKLYKENGDFGFSFNKISVPTAGAIFKKDIMIPPKKWAEEIYNLIQWNVYDGGHFAALEKPEILAKDLEDFVAKLEI